MSDSSLSARQWLRENGYCETAAIIDEIEDEWHRQGKKTRRNWWDVLAGDSKGGPRTIEGRVFPVLKAAQLRQGVPVTVEDPQPPTRITTPRADNNPAPQETKRPSPLARFFRWLSGA